MAKCSAAYAERRETQAQVDALIALQSKATEDRDFLEHAIAELDRLAPKAGEDAILAEERKFLQGAEGALTELTAAQDALGDVVFVELPEVGKVMDAGEEAGVVESVKAASDVYAPITGEVLEVNQKVEDDPEIVNAEPYGDGWFYRLKPSDVAELENLLTAEDYEQRCEDE